MKTKVTVALVHEANACGLQFRCDDCAHFDREANACVHGYPTEIHRRTLDADEIVFCKEFEVS